jgi:hypothetical protein
VLHNIPNLGWGRGKDCTFAGALEAALSVTEHPCKYSDIMGFTALAFRVRWLASGWCPSAAVGEMEEEIESVGRATGWPLKVEVHIDAGDRSAYTDGIVRAIDAGRPCLSYTDHSDMAVIFGYREDGKKLFFQDYFHPEPSELNTSQIGWLWLVLDGYREALPQRQAVIEGLQKARFNWRRAIGREGPGEYRYGPDAYDAWILVLERGDSTEADLAGLLDCHAWCLAALNDARQAATIFLREHAIMWQGSPRDALERAADTYQQMVRLLGSSEHAEVFRGRRYEKDVKLWVPSARDQQLALLRQCARMDAAAITEIDNALAAIETG